MSQFLPNDNFIRSFETFYVSRVSKFQQEVSNALERLRQRDQARPQFWFNLLREARQSFQSSLEVTEEARSIVAQAESARAQKLRSLENVDPEDVPERLNMERRLDIMRDQIAAMERLIDDYLDELEQAAETEERTPFIVYAATAEAVRRVSSKFQSRAAFYGRDQATETYNTVSRVFDTYAGAETYVWLRTRSENPRERHLKRVGNVYRYDRSPFDHPGDLHECKCGRRPIITK